MSSKALDWAFRQSLKPVTKAVLVAMADTADDDGYLFPSYEYLIYKTDVSQRTLVAAVKELVALELIVSEKNYREGYRLANLFFLMLDNRAHMKPAWTGRVSTIARKVQLEEFRGRSENRRATTAPRDEHVDAEAADSGSAASAPRVSSDLSEQVANESQSVEEPIDGGSAATALSQGDHDIPGSAGSAHTVSAIDQGNGETPETAVVQDLHLGGPYVQNMQSVSANSAHAPLKEPHDDLSHHQSARDDSRQSAGTAADPAMMMIDDSLTHSGVNLKSLGIRITSVLGVIPPDRLRWVVDEALSKASRVSNPLAFVAKCVQNDPGRFRPVSAARPASSGGLLVPGDEPCPKDDHGQYRAVNCPACRVEERVVTAVDNESKMSAGELAAWRHQRRANRLTDRRGGRSEVVSPSASIRGG